MGLGNVLLWALLYEESIHHYWALSRRLFVSWAGQQRARTLQTEPRLSSGYQSLNRSGVATRKPIGAGDL